MRILPKTWVLGALALFLCFVAMLDRGARSGADDGMPRLPPLDRDTATRIEITSVTEKIVVEKTAPDTWKLTAPPESWISATASTASICCGAASPASSASSSTAPAGAAGA